MELIELAFTFLEINKIIKSIRNEKINFSFFCIYKSPLMKKLLHKVKKISIINIEKLFLI